MPGDLSDPECMFPYHYDPRYEPGTDAFDSRPLGLDQVIQMAASESLGRKIGPEELSRARSHLAEMRLDGRNPGEQEVQDAIRSYFRTMSAVRKAARCRI